MIKINLDLLETGEHSHIFERAKLEASIFTGETKVTDP